MWQEQFSRLVSWAQPKAATNGRAARHVAIRDGVGRPVSAPSSNANLSTKDENRAKIERMVKDIEADPQFKIGYLTIAALVQYANVTVESSSTDPAAIRLAAHLQEQWYRTVGAMMRAFGYGRQAFEFWYQDQPRGGLRLLDKIAPLPFGQTEREEDGRIRVGSDSRGDAAPRLDEDCGWFLTVDADAEYPDGKSRYLGAAEEVMRQRKLLAKNYTTYLGKFANGVAIGKAPSQYPDSPLTGKGDAGQVDEYGVPLNPQSDVAEAYRRAESGGIVVLSSATDPENGTPLFDVSLQTIQPQSAALENKERALNDAALMAIGVPPRAVSQDAAVGSLALAEAHRKVLNATIEGLLTQFATQFESGPAKQVAIVNFGGRVEFRVTWQPLEEDRTQLVLELVKGIVASPTVSPLISEGVLDLDKLLDVAAIPKGKDVAGAMQRINEAAKLAPPAPGGFPPRFQLAATDKQDNPPKLDTWPDAAKELADKIAAGRAKLAETLGSSQDWGSL